MLTAEDLALGTGEWVLYDKYKDEGYRVLIKHDAISARKIFRDFREVAGRVTALSQPAISLVDFLAQFEDLESRWPGRFAPYTLELVSRCATFQTAILARQKCPWEDLPDEHIPIALSLRCLVLTREIVEVEGTMPSWIRDEDEERTYFQTYHDEGPLIGVTRMSSRERSCPCGPQADSEERIPSLLENLVQTIQRLIMRQEPREWPMVLCTLCIFKHISDDYVTYTIPMSVLELSFKAIRSTYSALCHWFHVCSQTLQPLTDHWEKGAFAELVDDDPLLLEMFQWFNDGWLEGISPFCSRAGPLPDTLFGTHVSRDPVSMRMVFQRVCLWRNGSHMSRQVMRFGEMNFRTIMSCTHLTVFED